MPDGAGLVATGAQERADGVRHRLERVELGFELALAGLDRLQCLLLGRVGLGGLGLCRLELLGEGLDLVPCGLGLLREAVGLRLRRPDLASLRVDLVPQDSDGFDEGLAILRDVVQVLLTDGRLGGW